MDGALDLDLAERIDAVLPQTQCGRCGHSGCRPYAEAVAAGAPINRCPPGGEAGVAAIAAIVHRPVAALDPQLGPPGVDTRAVIDEARCSGCTLCIQACPVDAIVGGPKRLHGVLAALCTGCELCLPPCPVDCIALIPMGRRWSPEDASAARARHRARTSRLRRDAKPARTSDAHAGADESSPAPMAATPVVLAPEARRAAVAAALARARARRATA